MSETDANPSPGTDLGRRAESEAPREARRFPGQPVLAGKHTVKYQSRDGQVSASQARFRLRGAAVVYVVDRVPDRLDKAGELGAVPVDYTASDPAGQIIEQQRRRRREGAWRGEDALSGVSCAIDAVGFQARTFGDAAREDLRRVIHDLARLVNPTGRLGIIGVFPAEDPNGVDGLEREGRLDVPWGKLLARGVTIGMGRDHDKRYNDFLRDLIAAGRIRPSEIVSHRLPLEDAPDAFRRFDERRDGYLKIVIDTAA
jgi:glutathione-independent formaldehyde dehydrogenase